MRFFLLPSLLGVVALLEPRSSFAADVFPPAPEPHVQLVRPLTPEGEHYRSEEDRVQLAGRFQYQGVVGPEFRNGFALTGSLGLSPWRHSQAVAALEAGYAVTFAGNGPSNLFSVGAGVMGRGARLQADGKPAYEASLGLVPSFVAGWVDGGFARGIKTSVEMGGAGAGISLAHQVLWEPGRVAHAFLFAIGVWYPQPTIAVAR